jgi:hypothetical protein
MGSTHQQVVFNVSHCFDAKEPSLLHIERDIPENTVDGMMVELLIPLIPVNGVS